MVFIILALKLVMEFSLSYFDSLNKLVEQKDVRGICFYVPDLSVMEFSLSYFDSLNKLVEQKDVRGVCIYVPDLSVTELCLM